MGLLRPLILLALGLVVILVLRDPTTTRKPPPFAIRFDAGSDHPSQDHRGRLYLADQEWTPEVQSGYLGGYRVWNSEEAHPTDGTPDPLLYTNQRHGWEEYRFSNVPNGDYLVTLSFSDVGIPAYTVFDVAVEGRTVLESLRVFDQVGGNYALTRRFAVAVSDGELNVNARPIAGDPRLAAIAVESRSPDDVAPAPPAAPTTLSSYHAVLLDWADSAEDDLDGYHVYRASSPEGPYTRLTLEPTYISRYRDGDVTPHTTYHYRVSGVDVYGNESDPTPRLAGTALDLDDATLPAYELDISSENLLYLYNHTFSYEEVNGSLVYQSQVFPVLVRYRGGYGRFIHKKSWKIKFPNRTPFPGRSEINLRADYADRTMMRTKLATDLHAAAGVQVPEAEHVLLMLNGKYAGVFTLNEQVDEGFLARVGQDPGVSIYKTAHTDTNDWSRSQPSEQGYYAAYQKKTNQNTGHDDIIAFIERINDTPDATFAYELGRAFDVAGYLDYYAVIVLTSNSDFVHHNVYLLHDLKTDRWGIAPYDLDAGFRVSDRPIDMGTATSPVSPYGFDSVLLTRVLNVPQFRAYYCHRLTEFLDTFFSEEAMASLIDATYAAIEQDGLRDWHKRYRENNAWFVAGPAEIKTYVTERRAFLWREIPVYCPADRPYLKINEVAAGDQPAWFEIHNQGLEPVNLAGMYLTDDLNTPAKFRIPSTTIPAGGFLTFIADGDPESGPLHTNFGLSEAGGELGIFSGTQQIDAYVFGPQPAGISLGRHPDGVDNWIRFDAPTPGGSNLLYPPIVSGVTHAPLQPATSDTVTVTATITDDGTLLTTTLSYRVAGGDFAEVGMAHLGANLFAAPIPPQPGGNLVEYRVVATDDDGQTGAASGGYIVDHRPPTVVINEFQADNEATLCDASGCPDWIELYNSGLDPVDLGGKYLTDDLTDPTKFRIPDGVVIPAGGFALFYADGDPTRGPLHTNFRLNREGESIGLFDADATGNRPIDTYTFGPQAADVSEQRYPDGEDVWIMARTPTPGRANAAGRVSSD